jgi:hypothetical protein
LVKTNVGTVPGSVLQKLPGGIHQAETAVIVGTSAGVPVRFECGPDDRVMLHVGDQAVDTGLLVAQARPMASFVAGRSNGLISLNDVTTRDGKTIYSPKVAGPYIDTAEGYWLLWADAFAGDSLLWVALGGAPDGLTIVDSEHPVTISTNSDSGLTIRGGEPRVAFWRRLGGNRGTLLDYRDFDVIKARDPDDLKALTAVRRVFKWAPVMRLAADRDPIAFGTFVRRLESIQIASVPTPRRLEARSSR